MRNFDSGATRDTDEGKLDFEGFLSHDVLIRFGQYMNENRIQADGKIRASDNWQKGIPQDAYMKSGFRHFMDWWNCHRGGEPVDRDVLQDSICALLFNAMGYLHEELKLPGEKTADQKIRDGLAADLAEKIPGLKKISDMIDWEDARRVVKAPLHDDCGVSEPITHGEGHYEVDPNEADTTKNGCYETPTLIPGRARRHCGDDYPVSVEAPEWTVTCDCGWDGNTDDLVLDQTNKCCLCPSCLAPLMGMSIRVEIEGDETNLYEQIGKTVSLGLTYGAGLPKIMELVENIFIKETSK